MYKENAITGNNFLLSDSKEDLSLFNEDKPDLTKYKLQAEDKLKSLVEYKRQKKNAKLVIPQG